VVYGLPAVRADVDDDAEAAVGQAKSPGDVGRRLEELAEQQRVIRGRVKEIGEGPLGDDQDVGGCLWRHVAEGQNVVILVDDIGGDLAPDDLAEEGICHLRALPMPEGVAAGQNVRQPDGDDLTPERGGCLELDADVVVGVPGQPAVPRAFGFHQNGDDAA